MNAPDPHDYETIYDYADVLPDHHDFFGKHKTLSTFETLRKQKDTAFRMFYQKLKVEDSEDEWTIHVESFWIDKDGRIITDVVERQRHELKAHLQRIIDQMDVVKNVNKSASYDEHVNTSRTEYTFTLGDKHYVISSNEYIGSTKLVLTS